MNNFIVGQVTPNMLEPMRWGRFIVFGVLTFIGPAFIILYVPEATQLTLEEMDVKSGPSGVIQPVSKRMEQVTRDIALTQRIRHSVSGPGRSGN